MKTFAAVVLAAGKGTRINAKRINKVMYPLAGKPMISYTVHLLKKVGIKRIVIVVGFLKESIINYLGSNYIYAYQKRTLGTAHAVKTALPKISSEVKNILVMHADDSAFLPPKVIKGLIKKHLKEKAQLTFLTVEMEKPNIARVLRNSKGKIIGVVELQNMKSDQEKINEINCGCYCFSKSFLEKFLPKIRKNSLTGEYYLPKLIELGLKANLRVKAFKMRKEDYFHSINTKDQLNKAKLKMKIKLIKNG
ncbi:NTP transferase domain-containing protein [Patescibacteria group bacterium]